ncbi:MAG: hypothetical protein AB1411_06640 [Nitrospirota bacterium]
MPELEQGVDVDPCHHQNNGQGTEGQTPEERKAHHVPPNGSEKGKQSDCSALLDVGKSIHSIAFGNQVVPVSRIESTVGFDLHNPFSLWKYPDEGLLNKQHKHQILEEFFSLHEPSASHLLTTRKAHAQTMTVIHNRPDWQMFDNRPE